VKSSLAVTSSRLPRAVLPMLLGLPSLWPIAGPWYVYVPGRKNKSRPPIKRTFSVTRARHSARV
jgi:hypothetical protein